MAEEKQHHFFHRKEKNEEEGCEVKTEKKHHKHLGKAAALGAAAVGAYALHEKHAAKKNPEDAHKHKIKEEVAAVVALGAGGVALHEHHKKKEAKE